MGIWDWIRGISKEDKLLKYVKEENNEKILKKLSEGAKPNVFDKEGKTPLHHAVMTGEHYGNKIL